jgi:hypothetical protein
MDDHLSALVVLGEYEPEHAATELLKDCGSPFFFTTYYPSMGNAGILSDYETRILKTLCVLCDLCGLTTWRLCG